MGFSHEVRNFVNGLTGSIQTCLFEIQENQKVISHLNNAKFCAGMLLQLMNNMLDSGKAGYGQLDISCQNENIYSTLNNAWLTITEMIRRKDLKGYISIMDILLRISTQIITDSLKFF